MLPQPAHAREVVLELGELDLQLAFGASRVLREDVEDELRPIDDAGLQCVFERALLRRGQLVVDEEHLGLRLGVGALELTELALAHERPRIGMDALLDHLADGRNAGGSRELAQLRELHSGIRSLGIDANEKPALLLRPGRGIGLARSHREIMPLYAPRVTALADRLAARTLELVDIPSESGDERAIREHLLGLAPTAGASSTRATRRSCSSHRGASGLPLVVLAAHYDTVPAQQNLPGRIADGAVHGLGASDMKGGLAVAVELSRGLDLEQATCDLALLLFGREELPAEHNPLPALFAGSSAVHESTLAIVLEPTDLTIQAGCLGNVVARLTFTGTSGHAARPWLADSALARAIRGLEPLLDVAPRSAVVGGLEFKEVLSLTRLESGIADNVIPGLATATLNLRYPPDRTPAEAEAFLASLAPGGCDARAREQQPACGRRRRLARGPRAAAGRRSRRRAQAGVDERRRLHVARARGGQLRAWAHGARAPSAGTGRDRRARQRLRDRSSDFVTSPIGEDAA